MLFGLKLPRTPCGVLFLAAWARTNCNAGTRFSSRKADSGSRSARSRISFRVYPHLSTIPAASGLATATK